MTSSEKLELESSIDSMDPLINQTASLVQFPSESMELVGGGEEGVVKGRGGEKGRAWVIGWGGVEVRQGKDECSDDEVERERRVRGERGSKRWVKRVKMVEKKIYISLERE